MTIFGLKWFILCDRDRVLRGNGPPKIFCAVLGFGAKKCMAGKHTALTASEAEAYYNRFGKKQDSQGFYEDPALNDLIAHASFQDAQRVFEFGCGTGKFAARLTHSC